jgi:GT2 family glycosyltransferase
LVVGSVACYGKHWVDRGAHLAKFDMWLPGGSRRPIGIAPTLNALCSRDLFEAVGRFPGEYMIGDTLFSWRAAAAGFSVTFEPEAVVWHHHRMTWTGLLRERFARGEEFGRVRSKDWGGAQLLVHLLASVLPLRWARLMARTWRHAAQAHLLSDFLATLPIVATGHAAWLLGEGRGFLRRLTQRG